MNYEIIAGDCLQTLKTLPANSVQTCITSPPYYGLRDYGTATWEGGDAACDHLGKPMPTRAGFNERYFGRESSAGNKQDELREPFKNVCGKCGARRIDAQLGLESSPELYVAKLVEVFREVRRVLRDDGTLWLNLASSYNGSGGAGGDYGPGGLKEGQPKYAGRNLSNFKPKDMIPIPWMVAMALQQDGWWLRADIIWAKPNPMPSSVRDRPTTAHEYIFLLSKGQTVTRVVALSDLPDKFVHFGYNLWLNPPYVGSDKIAVFLATSILDVAQSKYDLRLSPFDSEVGQQCLADAYSKQVACLPEVHRATILAARLLGAHSTTKQFFCELYSLGIALSDCDKLLIGGGAIELSLAPPINSDGKTAIAVHDSGKVCKFDFVHGKIITQSHRSCNYYYDADAIREPAQQRIVTDTAIRRNGDKTSGHAYGGGNDGVGAHPNGRNRRSVWTVPTRPYKMAHFATFPPDLITPCILAGSSAHGACANCGAPWARVVEKGDLVPSGSRTDVIQTTGNGETSCQRPGHAVSMFRREKETVGWAATCACNADVKPCVVLDPFSGSGTTGAVALKHNRHYIGLELNPDYIELSHKRIGQAQPLLPLEGAL